MKTSPGAPGMGSRRNALGGCDQSALSSRSDAESRIAAWCDDAGSLLRGCCAGAVEDAGGGADVHVQGGADVGVAGDGGDVGGVEFPSEQGGSAQDVTQAVPGPASVAVLVAPAGLVVGGGQDAAVEIGGPPPDAARGREQQPRRVGPGVLLGPGLLEAGGELLGERVALGGAGGVDGLAALAALGRTGQELAGDLDDLAVHVDDPGGR